MLCCIFTFMITVGLSFYINTELHSKTQKDNFDFAAKLLSEKMSDINIEASFSDGEFAQKHIARRVGFLRCRHLSKHVVATSVATKYFDSLDIHNNSNLFMFLIYYVSKNVSLYYINNKNGGSHEDASA